MLHLHRAERADLLAHALADVLTAPAEDPFEPELVSVPTRGMERWLSQRLAVRLGAQQGRGDGICANVLFPSPRALIEDVLAGACGIDPEADPWLPERAVWPLLETIEATLAEPWLATLATHLGRDPERPDPLREGRRLSVARHLAELFYRYGLQRPEMVAAWARGENTDGTGAPLEPALAWQPELWRELRARIGIPSGAERLAPATERLRAAPQDLALPARLSLFGLTRVAAGDLAVLAALAAARELHLFLLHPSPSLWTALASVPTAPIERRADDPTAKLPHHPLLRSWGRDAREMQRVLARAGDTVDHHHPLTVEPRTLLERVQAAIRADADPAGVPLPGQEDGRAELSAEDRSIQIHSCHGRGRQVEVMRDAVLHSLAEDPSLEPRDVIVMCPDIEAFAPLIQATFGVGERPDDAPASGPSADAIDLRVRLADRSLRQTNPVLAVVAELLELPGSRLTASQVLDFASREPVRRRFGLREDDLPRLQAWVRQSGIRWGLDADHRAAFRLEGLRAGTWRAGLDRLLLGVTMTEEHVRTFAGVLPLDDVASGAIDLAGRFAELLERLGDALDSLTPAQPIEAWARSIAAAADALTATAPREAWQRGELGRLLDEITSEASADVVALSRPEVRALLANRLAGRPTRANFRTGHLTVCTLYPMRSVPHRVICLLGLDDGAFPRKAPRDGDDLMLVAPQVGERDPRSEDRQLLLDALLAAGERLIITYTGNDERTNAPRPPAVPVGELLDLVDATARAESGAASEQVLVRHPLQPFDAQNFAAGAVAGREPWSFDTVALAGAQAQRSPRIPPPPFLAGRLPAVDAPVIALEDLVRFVQHPVRAFLRQRLAISLAVAADEVEDALAVELDALERWGVGQRILDSLMAGVEGRAAAKAEVARGLLPPTVLGKAVIDRVYPIAERIATAARRVCPDQALGDPLDVRFALADGRLLSGTMSPRGDILLTATFSRVAARHRLSAWVNLLAGTVAAPERALAAVTVGRGGSDGDVVLARIAPLADEPEGRRQAAVAALEALVELYDAGMREPLPLPCATAGAYAHAAHHGLDPVAAACAEWESEWNWPREDADPEHELVLGGRLQLAELLEVRPADWERGTGWAEADPSRLGRLARRLWRGLLEREELADG